MKNITLQYKELLEGKMHKETFVRNVRMMFPEIVSPSTSFKDAMTILKNRRILKEEVNPEQLKMGIEVEKEHTDDPAVAEKIARDHLAEDPAYYTKLTQAGLEEEGEDDLLNLHKKFPGMKPIPDPFGAKKTSNNPKDFNAKTGQYSTGSPDPLARSAKKKIQAHTKSLTPPGFEKLPEAGPKAIPTVSMEQALDYLEQHLDQKYVPDAIDYLKQVMKQNYIPQDEIEIELLDDIVGEVGGLFEKKSLKEGKTNSGFTYLETKVETPDIDKVDPYLLKRAVEFEMSKLRDISGDAYRNCVDKAVKNLRKNPTFYKHLQIANFEEVKKYDDEFLKMKEVKKKPEASKTRPDGFAKKPLKKAEKANTSATKKENKSGKNPNKVQTLKEDVLKELRATKTKKKDSLKEDHHHKYNVGSQVNTPDGPGVITALVGSTVTVEFGDGHSADYQLNVLNRQAATDQFNKMGNKFSAVQNPFEEEKKEEVLPEKNEKKDNLIKRLREYFSKKKAANEAKKFKASGETIFKSDAEAQGYEQDLRKAGVKYVKSNA